MATKAKVRKLKKSKLKKIFINGGEYYYKFMWTNKFNIVVVYDKEGNYLFDDEVSGLTRQDAKQVIECWLDC